MGNKIEGGARGGVIIVSYKSILFRVRNADNPPTARAIAIEIT